MTSGAHRFDAVALRTSSDWRCKKVGPTSSQFTRSLERIVVKLFHVPNR